MNILGFNITRGDKPIKGRRTYAAAQQGRLFADWVFAPTSANQELRNGALRVIRDRARDCERNDNLARKFLSMCEANVVGRGFVLQVASEDKDARAVEQAFGEWLDHADVAGRLSGVEMQNLTVRTTARDGECFKRIYRGSNYHHGIGIQVLESDYIDETYTTEQGDARIVMGVELDPLGQEIAYHVYERHPGDTGLGGTATIRRIRIAADDMLHIYRAERPGQVRAVSWMASGMAALKMLRGYQEAELVAARSAACKGGFYKIPAGEDFQADGKNSDGSPVSDLAPGTFERMPTGWEFQQYDPTHPTSQYGTFVKDIIRDLASGWEVAYNNLANDLENVNYSSIRQGTIEEREQWIVKQAIFAHQDMRGMYRAWLPVAVASGAIKIPAKKVEAFLNADKWVGRRWTWVDPKGDMEAKALEIGLGLTSPSKLASEAGTDYVTNVKQLAIDNKTRVDAGLPPLAAAAPVEPPKGAKQ